MRRALSCIVVIALAPGFAAAQVRSFPYEAVIETDGVPVHSGPDGKFYETSRLKRGSRVVVHRHDPAGWYMIAPPAAEFSLVKAEEIRVLGHGAAEIVAEEVDVRIGSYVSSRHDAIQVPLTRGDRVQLLDGAKPPEGWVAIRPVRGEYRWIPGRYVVPVTEKVRSELDADPFAVPSVAKRPESFDGMLPQKGSSASKVAQGPKLTLGAPEADPVETGVAKTSDAMRMLDRELEGLALTEPTEWPLDELEVEYRRLREANPSTGRRIDARLAQIGRMRMVKEHYGDYVRLTSATDMRDATLVARQASPFSTSPDQLADGPMPASPQLGPVLAEPRETPIPALADARPLAGDPDQSVRPLPPAAPQPEPRPLFQGGSPYPTVAGRASPTQPLPASRPSDEMKGPILMAPDVSTPTDRIADPTSPAPPPSVIRQNGPPPAPPTGAAGARRFDAVGIVQKAVDPHPEAPQFVLLAPNGRILTYLQEQPGIPLEKFVGQPMGVDGEKHHHPELKTPMIVVDRLTPVRY